MEKESPESPMELLPGEELKMEAGLPAEREPNGETVVISAGLDLQEFLAIAQKRLVIMPKLIQLAARRTSVYDWVDMGNRPYLTGTGAEKIATAFGCRICNVKIEKRTSEDELGAFYFYIVFADVSLPQDLGSLQVIGTCSSRDQFFARKHGQWRPLSEVDETNIVKAAYTNMEVNGMSRLLGLRGLTWSALEELGIDRKAVAQVQYKKGGRK